MMPVPRTTRTRPEPQCPIRPGEPCTLCLGSVTGPQDCGLVWLVMTDADLSRELQVARSIRRTDSVAPPPIEPERGSS